MLMIPRRRRPVDSPAPGIRKHGAGWQTAVTVRGERSYEQWPLDTPVREMTTWQKDERAKLRLALPAVRGGTFPADAQRYLELSSVKAMPTYSERVQHLKEWVTVFGARRRRSISALEIEAQRDRLLADPRAIEDDGTVIKGPYSAAAVNKRLRALSNLYTKLDGRRAPNPVLEVHECEEPDPESRGLPYDVIEAILGAIPEAAIGMKKDGTRTIGKARPSQTKARLRVIAYTGIPHSTLKRLTAESVILFPVDEHGNETGGTVRLPPRRKGKKRRRAQDKPLPETLPLIPPAAAAFRQFDRLGCWGPFSNSSMWKAFQRACATLNIEGLTPYDFRHSFLTAVFDETRDLRVTGKMGSHRSDRTVKRYTMAAVAPHVQEAANKVAARLALKLASGAPDTERNAVESSGRQSRRHPEG